MALPRPARSVPRAPLQAASAIALLALLTLGGCSTVRTLDTSVVSFAGQSAAVAQATYRLERLPSQQQQPNRAALDAMAHEALAAAGLQRDDAAARYSVEMSVSVQSYLPQAPLLFSRHGRIVIAPDGSTWQQVPWGLESSPRYRYQLRLVFRNTADAQVSYETHSEADTGWSDTSHVVPALLKAALQDYPTPPAGVRKVTLEVGGTETPPRP